MTVSTLELIQIPVRNLETSLAFYRQALGFELIHIEQEAFHLRREGVNGILSLTEKISDPKPGSVQGLVVSTSNLAVCYARLTAMGVVIDKVVEVLGGKFATFTDPDGNGWVLLEAESAVMLA